MGSPPLSSLHSQISFTSASFKASKMSFKQAFLVFSLRISKSGALPAGGAEGFTAVAGEALASWAAELGAGLALPTDDTGGVAPAEALPAGGVAFAEVGVVFPLSPPF
jgi:hypothetical protein